MVTLVAATLRQAQPLLSANEIKKEAAFVLNSALPEHGRSGTPAPFVLRRH
jgi:hypothetical protein